MKGSIALGMEQSEFFTPHTHIQTPPQYSHWLLLNIITIKVGIDRKRNKKRVFKRIGFFIYFEKRPNYESLSLD